MNNTYLKSALNYIGGKHKLLPQIIPKFPKNIKTFVDLFGGGFNVGANVEADIIFYNDINSYVVKLLEIFYSNNLEEILSFIDNYIEKFQLSKTNQQGYLNFREYFNQGIENDFEWATAFYTLICYAFNNQIRFNSNGGFNMPFGKDRSSFNPTLRQKFIEFFTAIQKKEIYFFNNDFRNCKFDTLTEQDFLYIDSPYLNSVATYNENGGWTEKEENNLLYICDNLTEKGIKWALSNNLKCDNPILKEWLTKPNKYITYLNHSYGNCNYQKTDRTPDIEVLITNYKVIE